MCLGRGRGTAVLIQQCRVLWYSQAARLQHVVINTITTRNIILLFICELPDGRGGNWKLLPPTRPTPLPLYLPPGIFWRIMNLFLDWRYFYVLENWGSRKPSLSCLLTLSEWTRGKNLKGVGVIIMDKKDESWFFKLNCVRICSTAVMMIPGHMDSVYTLFSPSLQLVPCPAVALLPKQSRYNRNKKEMWMLSGLITDKALSIVIKNGSGRRTSLWWIHDSYSGNRSLSFFCLPEMGWCLISAYHCCGGLVVSLPSRSPVPGSNLGPVSFAFVR